MLAITNRAIVTPKATILITVNHSDVFEVDAKLVVRSIGNLRGSARFAHVKDNDEFELAYEDKNKHSKF